MMKKYIKLSFYSLLCLATIMSFYACSDDESYDVTGDPNNRFYILNRNWSGDMNGYEFSVTHAPVGLVSEVPSLKSPIRSTRPAGSVLTVTVKHDPSLVEEYNASKKTEYAACPEKVVLLVKSSVTFEVGSYLSKDSIEISLSEESINELTEPEYLLPIRIADMDEGAPSSNRGVIWLVLHANYTNIKQMESINDMNGFTISNYNGWIVKIKDEVKDGKLIFDANTANTYLTLGSGTISMTHDMLKEKTVSGFMFQSNNSAQISRVGVSISSDKETWTSLGEGSLFGASGYEQYISFYEVAKARYIKLDLTASRSYSLKTMRVYTTDTEEIIPVTGVTLNKSKLTFTEIGESEKLISTIAPVEASDQRVAWESSNANVATVDTDGNIKAVGQGEATITVKTVDRNKTAQCAVKVVIVENLFTNPGFETTQSEFNSGKFQDGLYWHVYDSNKAPNWGPGEPNSSIRTTHPEYVNDGTHAFILHSGFRYLTQKIDGNKLKPNTTYKISYVYCTSSAASSNGGAIYKILLGTQEFDKDVIETDAHTTLTTTSSKQTFTKTFTTPANVPASVWFTLYRSGGRPSGVDWLDSMSFKEVLE